MTFPEFTIKGYANLINRIVNNGFEINPISALPGKRDNSVYLRHDVDISVSLVLDIAELESALGISSTYFILLTGIYNPFHEESVFAIKKLKSLGHEIGLHYDLKNWPSNEKDSNNKLKEELAILESIADSKIAAIVMHEPFRGTEDFFAKDMSELSYINPTYYQKTDRNLCYVSDSCRAWRDDSLLKFIDRKMPQTRLMLNTHPELWMASRKQSRISFLENELTPAVIKPITRYFENTVRPVWEMHHAKMTGYEDNDN